MRRARGRLCIAWLVPGFLPIPKTNYFGRWKEIMMNAGTNVWIEGRMFFSKKSLGDIRKLKIGSEC